MFYAREGWLALKYFRGRTLGLPVPSTLLVAAGDKLIEWRFDEQVFCCEGFQTLRDVRLEPGMRAKADVRRPLWIYVFTP
jgi:hypothetical protein